MKNRQIVLFLFVALTGVSHGEEIVLPDQLTKLSKPPDENGMQAGYKYGVGWFCVVPFGIRESSVSRPVMQVDLEMWTARRSSHVFSVRCTAKTQDYVWFGDGYRRILTITQPVDANERGIVKIEPKSAKVEGLPTLSGVLLPVRKEHEHADLWGGGGFVREIRAIDGGEELEAEFALLDSLVHPIHFDRPADRTVVMRKGDVIEVPVKVDKGRVTAKIRCAGIYREMADKGFSGGVDLVPIDWTSHEDAR